MRQYAAAQEFAKLLLDVARERSLVLACSGEEITEVALYDLVQERVFRPMPHIIAEPVRSVARYSTRAMDRCRHRAAREQRTRRMGSVSSREVKREAWRRWRPRQRLALPAVPSTLTRSAKLHARTLPATGASRLRARCPGRSRQRSAIKRSQWLWGARRRDRNPCQWLWGARQLVSNPRTVTPEPVAAAKIVRTGSREARYDEFVAISGSREALYDEFVVSCGSRGGQ